MPSAIRGRSSTDSEQFVSTEQVGGSNPLALFFRLRSSTESERKNMNLEAAGSNPAEAARINYEFQITNYESSFLFVI